ncbi:hybrid sensor histidine kinase/response regulator [Oceanobacter mangrovi]|uniref:hybrid sensor histidine kinase/response regulator n=1 Tax=Oceanobacter mangrovi TaxID=2862510 RepID=UPI001C8D512D|nr:ATP-binding protein [Oceanobacter mangrovi]
MSKQSPYSSRRSYNRWVANQTLEDFALRFTAKSARRWSAARVSNTALGAISFLALEAIGATVTLLYGFHSAVAAIMVVSALIFLSSIPISYYAARYGVDIDLLSRGAGFGYIGSTVTSLIYASFTFIFFALEAAIMASAMEMLFGLPLWAGYLFSSVLVIPLVTHGITFISRFQVWSQPLWLLLQITPFIYILWHEWQAALEWVNFAGVMPATTAAHDGSHFDLILFGATSAVVFSLVAQIGEQVDFLRFLPEPEKDHRLRWWLALLVGGPGWIVVGMLKILAGSFLAVLALRSGMSALDATDPTRIYYVAFGYLSDSPMVVLALTGLFVVLCQVKINVTNAYAGSIAWSNFFSRLTHSHPGRVVWLAFNVMIALLLMLLGVYESLERILGIYSNVAVAWVGALVADLIINKPLGLSPKHIEFKRAYLYDINPVGFGAMVLASILGIMCFSGLFGELAQAMSSYIALAAALLLSPLLALLTRGRFYLARPIQQVPLGNCQCTVCENHFDSEDMAVCPLYQGAICSLCCTLESRCHDQCKDKARLSEQIQQLLELVLPQWLVTRMNPRLLQFTGLMAIIGSVVGGLFWLVYMQIPTYSEGYALLSGVLVQVYLLLLIIMGVLIWLFVLANESRMFALKESQRQTELLQQEITAHEITDRALQQAKEQAESANRAKSRYLGGISHELRSPLNSIIGYAQLLEKDPSLSERQRDKVGLIHRSGDHLADLIEGLLDISRIEAGRLEIRRDEFDVHRLLDELVHMFRLQAESKGIEFEYRPSQYLPRIVRSDEKHLRQILINLLSNAVKFTVSGRVSLTVSYRSQVAEFTIVDTGPGISPQDRERIFQPFERIRKPGLPQTPGTGLGLTITRLLADIMGGDISLESQPGFGSVFRLSMMLSSVSGPGLKVVPERRIVGYRGDRKTFMVVDDDAAHRGLVSEILTPLGFDVLEAEDGWACLKMLQQTRVDLLLMDISMPGLTGWQLLRQIREDGDKTPVIMVSADAEDRQSAQARGDAADEEPRLNDGYLIKPIRDSKLLAAVGQVLQLQWRFEDEPDGITELNPRQRVDMTIGEARELLAAAEIGHIAGMEAVLVNMEVRQASTDLTRLLRQQLTGFRFGELITLAKKVINDESSDSHGHDHSSQQRSRADCG